MKINIMVTVTDDDGLLDVDRACRYVKEALDSYTPASIFDLCQVRPAVESEQGENVVKNCRIKGNEVAGISEQGWKCPECNKRDYTIQCAHCGERRSFGCFQGPGESEQGDCKHTYGDAMSGYHQWKYCPICGEKVNRRDK